MFDWLLNFAAWNVYGLAILLLPVFALVWLINKIIPKFPDPWAVTAIVGLIGMFVLPPLPVYRFDHDTSARLEQHSEFRLVSTAEYVSWWQPVTWILSPIHSFVLIRPVGIGLGGYQKDRAENTYVQLLLRYGEEEAGFMVDSDCEDRSFKISGPGEDGMMRQLPGKENMDGANFELYCEFDYSEQFREVMNKHIQH